MIARTNKKLWEAALALPKTDLHCHLDGSLRAETVLDIAQKEGIDIGFDNIDALKEKLVCGKKVESLSQFLDAFDITCSVLQSTEAIERVAYELAEDAAKENVWHLEVRYDPYQMQNKGLSIEDTVIAVEKGLKRAERDFKISTNIILAAMRNYTVERNTELAQYAVDLMPKYNVAGFDLCNAENGNPAKLRAHAFKIAKDGGLGITLHAGEDYGPASIKQAIDDCGAQRIGHGRTLVEDPELEKRCIKENIVIECCPSSNVQISLTPEFSDHPVLGYINRGVKATLSTDNRLLTGILVSDEYYRVAETLGTTMEDWIKLARHGFEGAFMNADQKQSLLNKFDAAIETWKSEHAF